MLAGRVKYIEASETMSKETLQQSWSEIIKGMEWKERESVQRNFKGKSIVLGN